MNLHFENKTLFESLKEASITKSIIGSHLYKTNNENSDIDYLYIYATSEKELFSPIRVHHQLQYKENDVDHIFVSYHTFIRNLLSGDSTINFELIFSDSLKETPLSFLNDMKESFITYTIIRAYLGFANRDVRFYNRCKNDYEMNKQLEHIHRGHLYSDSMLNYSFDFDKCNRELRDTTYENHNKTVKYYSKLISDNRKLLNDVFNKGLLKYPKKINPNDVNKLFDKSYELCSSSSFKEKQEHLKNFNIYQMLETFEKDINY